MHKQFLSQVGITVLSAKETVPPKENNLKFIKFFAIIIIENEREIIIMEYFYKGWKIEQFQSKYFVEVDDKEYTFNSIDDTYDFINEMIKE